MSIGTRAAAVAAAIALSAAGCTLTAPRGSDASSDARPASSGASCGSTHPGPWSICADAEWLRVVAAEAGFAVVGDTGAALVLERDRQRLYAWTTRPPRPPRLDVPTGSVTRQRWRASAQVMVWVEAYRDRLPPRPFLRRLVDASLDVPAPQRP